MRGEASGQRVRGRILLCTGAIAVCLVAAELFLALVAPQVHRLPDVWTHDPGLGWVHQPDAEGRLVTPEFDVAYRIDAAGRRQHGSGESPGGVHLQLYGDSFAEGWGVDVEDGLAAQLEARLHFSRGVATTNYGTAGYGTDQAMLLFERVGSALSPDVVLLLFYANDLWNNVSRRGMGARRGAKPFFRPSGGALQLMGTPIPEPAPRTPSLRQFLGERLHLWALAHRALATERPLPLAQMRQFYGGLYGRDQASYRSVWELTERLLGEFARLCRQNGAEFVLVYAPAIVQIEADGWRTKRDLHDLTGDYDLSHPGRQLQAISNRQKIPLVDLTSVFAAAAAQQTLYFRDSHWNEAGHRLAAETVAEALARLRIAALSGRDG